MNGTNDNNKNNNHNNDNDNNNNNDDNNNGMVDETTTTNNNNNQWNSIGFYPPSSPFSDLKEGGKNLPVWVLVIIRKIFMI